MTTERINQIKHDHRDNLEIMAALSLLEYLQELSTNPLTQ